MKRSILVILTFIFSANASMAQKFIKFERKENVFTSKKPISSVYKNKTEINVILRNSAYDFTNNKGSNRYSSNLFFNIIEKEFIKYGINVKDAALYKLEDKTINNNVDLMIDLASVTKVDFNRKEKKKQLTILIMLHSQDIHLISELWMHKIMRFWGFTHLISPLVLKDAK
jgi:hypothetical protein